MKIRYNGGFLPQKFIFDFIKSRLQYRAQNAQYYRRVLRENIDFWGVVTPFGLKNTFDYRPKKLKKISTLWERFEKKYGNF